MSALALSFARPALLAALGLPLLVWWLARRPRRPLEAATGTLEVWREVAGGRPPLGAQRRRRAPWLLLAALALGALALAGPRAARSAPAPWSVLVDRSPSMYLPHERGGTRLERALEAAAAELERLGASERLWLAFDGEDFVAAPGASPPEAWRRPPRAPHPEPDWARLDGPRTLCVSDAAPAPEPQAAGLVLSGGEAVPGPAAVGPGGTLLDFDGRDLVATERRAAPRAVSLAPSLPAPVRALAELWATERGLVADGGAGGALVALAIEGPGQASAAGVPSLWIGRDGWELEVTPAAGFEPGRGAARDFEPATQPWLESGGAVLVSGAPGRVRVSFTAQDEPRGDPAAFALWWAELLDACLLPPAGLVPIGERLAAGAARARAPRPADGAGDGERGGWPLEALLSAAAALLVLLSCAPRRASVRVP